MGKKKSSSAKTSGQSRWLEQKRYKKDKESLLNDKRTPLARRITRNIDQLLIVASIDQPEFKPGLVDRFLLLAHLENCEPILCISKADLAKDRAKLEHWQAFYKSIGIETYISSALTKEGVDEIKKLLQGKRTALAGHSGVGKSMLLNVIEPNLKIETGPISLATGKGRHVTKSVKLYRMNNQTDVLDLPGIKLIDFPDLTPLEVASLFPDFDPFAEECRFNDCTHIPEPDCAVKEAVKRNEVKPERYRSYLRIIEELED